MRKLLVFLFMLLLTTPAVAQTCNTGHFVFDVSDNWEFMTYADMFVYNTPNGDRVLAVEEDMTKYGEVAANTIIGMYNSFDDKEGFTLTELNGDPAAYFIETGPRKYSSFDRASAEFMYYKNGYLLYLTYEAGYSTEKEECLNELLKIANTLAYSEQDKSSFQLHSRATTHFEYGVPNGWFHIEQDGVDYFYGGNERDADGGMYFVEEYPLSSIEGASTMGVYAFYRMLANTIYEGFSPIGKLHSENITLDNLPAYTCSYLLDINSGYVYHTFLVHGDYFLVTTYMNSDGAGDPEYSTSIVEALNNRIKPLK